MAVNLLKEISDSYERRARLYPGAIAVLPISLFAVILVTSRPSVWSAVVLVVGVSGVSYLGAQLVRGAGRRMEQELWASWGGAPTTQMLRFRDSANRIAVQRRHDQLALLSPDLTIPDEAAELAEPALADQHYETAVRALIERTRDKTQFERVFDELCQYGFRRNLWACRKAGLWCAALGLLVTVALTVTTLLDIFAISLIGLSVLFIVNLLLLAVLSLVVRADWVRESADAYALQLLASLERLQ